MRGQMLDFMLSVCSDLAAVMHFFNNAVAINSVIDKSSVNLVDFRSCRLT